MLEGALIVNVTLVADPEDETLPEPLQPVQTYWTPEPPETGEETEAVMLEPALNQPVTGDGEPYEEDTVR
jgi:hypothetical protein